MTLETDLGIPDQELECGVLCPETGCGACPPSEHLTLVTRVVGGPVSTISLTPVYLSVLYPVALFCCDHTLPSSDTSLVADWFKWA